MKYTITIVIQRQGTPLHVSEPSEWTKILRIALLYSQPRSQRVSVLISKLVDSFIADTSIIRNLVTLWLRHRTIEQLSNKHSVKTYNFGGGGSSSKTQRVDGSSSSSSFGLLFAWPARSTTFDLPVNHNYTAKIPVGFSVVVSRRFDERDLVPTHPVIIEENNIVWHRNNRGV